MPESTRSHPPARPDQAGSYARSRRSREERLLFERYRASRDLAVRDQLVERFLPLAKHLARVHDGGARHHDDVVQVACIGLLNAIERFDPDRGSAFSSFAVPTILGEIKRYFRDRGWLLHVSRSLQERTLHLQRAIDALEGELGRAPTTAELAGRLDATVEEVLEARLAAGAHFGVSLDHPDPDGDDRALADEFGSEDDGFDHVEAAATVDSLLAGLDHRQRIILRLRFEHDLTQAEIGEYLGLSQMHISRLVRQAITELRATTNPPPSTPHPGRSTA